MWRSCRESHQQEKLMSTFSLLFVSLSLRLSLSLSLPLSGGLTLSHLGVCCPLLCEKDVLMLFSHSLSLCLSLSLTSGISGPSFAAVRTAGVTDSTSQKLSSRNLSLSLCLPLCLSFLSFFLLTRNFCSDFIQSDQGQIGAKRSKVSRSLVDVMSTPFTSSTGSGDCTDHSATPRLV